MGCSYSACWPKRGGGDEESYQRGNVLSELGHWKERVRQIKQLDGNDRDSQDFQREERNAKTRKKSRQKQKSSNFDSRQGIYDSAESTSLPRAVHSRSLSRLFHTFDGARGPKQGSIDPKMVAAGSDIIASVTSETDALSPEQAVLRPHRMSDIEIIGRRKSYHPDEELLTATEVRKAKAEVLARRASEPSLLSEQDSYTSRLLNPPYEIYRQSTLDMLEICKGEADDPLYASTVELAAKIFKVPSAAILFFNREKVWVKAAHSTLKEESAERSQTELPRHMILSSYMLLLDKPRVLVVEDVMQDGRFLDLVMNRMGVGAPYKFQATSFLAAAPLLAPNGYIMGVLELLDTQPRRLDAGAFNLLINLAEMTARSLLRDTTIDFAMLPPSIAQLQKAAEDDGTDLPISFGSGSTDKVDRRRSVSEAGRVKSGGLAKKTDSAFDKGIILCTAEEELLEGEIQIANASFVEMVGLHERDVLHQKLKDLFHISEYSEEDYKLLRKAYTKLRLMKAHATLKAHPDWRFTVEIKSAKANALDQHLPTIAVPNFIELCSTREHFRYFFLLFKVERPAFSTPASSLPPLPNPFSTHIPTFAFAAVADDEPWAARESVQANGSSRSSSDKSKMSVGKASITIPHNPEIFDDVILGPLLGRGSYGRVHRGLWNGDLVAVKIIETFKKGTLVDNEVEDLAEARLVEEMQHEHIVRTYTHCTRVKHFSRADSANSGANSWSGSNNEHTSQRNVASHSGFILETWLLLEYCDAGSLQDAIDRGWFRTEPSRLTGRPKCRTIASVALEIAKGMAYLHGKKLLHSDLTPGNVLLKEDKEKRHKFSVRIADFGLSRPTTSRTINTQTYGTVTHMPPELLSDGMLTKAADVYAFGVLLWSMFSGEAAWKGLRRTQVMFKVTSLKASLPHPSGCPSVFKSLLDKCMDRDYRARPGMSELVDVLEKILTEMALGTDLSKLVLKSSYVGVNPLYSKGSTLEDVDEDAPLSQTAMRQYLSSEEQQHSAEPKLTLLVMNSAASSPRRELDDWNGSFTSPSPGLGNRVDLEVL